MKRLLQIGTGRWGANHLRVLRSLPVEVHVSDLDPEAYARCCAPLDVPRERFSTDPRAFLDRVDAVDIVTPADTHFDLASEALARGKDVFVEKPITLTSREARVLAEDAEQRGLLLQVGHIFRFDPASLWLRSALKEGRFGEPYLLRARFSGFKRPRSDSGVLLADGIHFLDLQSFLLGRPPRRVTAVLRDFLGRGLDDEAWIGLGFDGEPGVWGTVECGYHLPGKAREILVLGSEMSAVCDFNEPENKVRTFRNRMVREGEEWKAQAGESEAVAFPRVETLQSELGAFVEALDSRQPPLADGWAGYESLKVVEAAFASARERRTVDLSDGDGRAGGPSGGESR